MLDHIAEQVGGETDIITDFARRTPTRYDQLAAIKASFGYSDLSRPLRAELTSWLTTEAMPTVDGYLLLYWLLDEMRVPASSYRASASSSAWQPRPCTGRKLISSPRSREASTSTCALVAFLHARFEAIGAASTAQETFEVTPKQAICLKWSAERKSMKEIAVTEGMSIATANVHLNNARKTLDASSLAQATALATKLRLV